jgi:DNA-binding IclR family transcriptional regulator
MGEKKIIARVEDLMFRAKIDAAARHLSTPVEFVATAGELAKACANGAAAAFVELTPEVLSVVAKMKKESRTGAVAVVGFLSHVDKKLAEEARAAGVDRVLARSQFSETLPDLILEFTSPGVERITEEEPELPEE